MIEASEIPLPKGDVGKQVGEVRQELREHLAQGEQCECSVCGSTIKVYARGIHAKMVRALAAVGDAPGGLSPSALSQITSGGDGQKLSAWGFIERGEEGAWTITSRGADWLRGRIKVPHKVITYNGEVLGFDRSKEVGISDVRHATVDLADILASWGREGIPQAAE